MKKIPESKSDSTLADDANQQESSLSTSTKAQCSRLLKYLTEVGPITTFETRELLDISHPAGRINNLRNAGNEIVTSMVSVDNGIAKHRIARYALLKHREAANDENCDLA